MISDDKIIELLSLLNEFMELSNSQLYKNEISNGYIDLAHMRKNSISSPNLPGFKNNSPIAVDLVDNKLIIKGDYIDVKNSFNNFTSINRSDIKSCQKHFYNVINSIIKLANLKYRINAILLNNHN